jgi:hypothetical protein
MPNAATLEISPFYLVLKIWFLILEVSKISG